MNENVKLSLSEL